MEGIELATDHTSLCPLQWWVLIIAALFFLGHGQFLWPQDLIFREAVVVSVVHPLAAGENSRYKEVISKALRLFLEKEGLVVITSPMLEGLLAGADGDSPGNMVAVYQKDLLAMARSLPGDFLWVTVYSISDHELQLMFSLYDIEEGIRCATVRRSISIDFTLDHLIGEAAEELLLSIKQKLARYSRLQAGPAQEPVLSADAPVLERPSLSPGPPPPDPKHFEVAAGAAPFLPLGRTSDYFKIGLCTVVQGVYRFGDGTVQVSAGLLAGTYLFQAQGLSGSADTLLLPVGPLIGIVRGFGSIIDLYIHLSGGMALMSITPNGLDDRLSKFLPFALAAAGFRLGFGNNLGLVAETNVAAFFETADGDQSPLLGFSPAVYLRLRF